MRPSRIYPLRTTLFLTIFSLCACDRLHKGKFKFAMPIFRILFKSQCIITIRHCFRLYGTTIDSAQLISRSWQFNWNRTAKMKTKKSVSTTNSGKKKFENHTDVRRTVAYGAFGGDVNVPHGGLFQQQQQQRKKTRQWKQKQQ